MEVSIVIGVPQIDGSIMEKPNLKWMIWGDLYFRKPPCGAV